MTAILDTAWHRAKHMTTLSRRYGAFTLAQVAAFASGSAGALEAAMVVNILIWSMLCGEAAAQARRIRRTYDDLSVTPTKEGAIEQSKR